MGDPNHVELAAKIISAFVANNSLPRNELAALIGEVHAAFARLSIGAPAAEPEVLTPAVPAKKSVSRDHLVCLEDGQKFKSLKRHLRTQHNLSPEQYRAKWGLPADYPMVAPAYAVTRSTLAKKMGLGQKRGRRK
ncbi:MAG TPA: MucR family transcriptional regulator [Roseiarcus sp.]|nr:MucR family transcriptional regulator [Roseiarcus sp.]